MKGDLAVIEVEGNGSSESAFQESNPTSPAPTPPPPVGPPVGYRMVDNEFGLNFKLVAQSDQMRELQTIIRDRYAIWLKFY